VAYIGCARPPCFGVTAFVRRAKLQCCSAHGLAHYPGVIVSRWIFLALWFATGTSGVFAATFSVTVKVVDAEKKPLPAAGVALFWNVKGPMMASGGREEFTDENGRIVLQVDDWNEKRPVLVLSRDRKLGAVVGVSKADDGKEVIATLGPTIRVTGKLECSELKAKPKWANTMITADGFRAHVAQYMGEAAEFEFVLPAGKYALRSYGTDMEDIKQTITLAADRPEFDLGMLDLKASPIAKLKGKTAPGWEITAARGVKAQTKLSDYKGKWIYLEFWGFW
jgi:hypothetical protein